MVATTLDSTPARPILKGKRAVVTGAASGIGRAVAELFARQGAKVVLGDRDEGAVQGLAQAIADGGGSASAAGVDVTSEDDVRRLFAMAAADGPVDVLVCAAGVAAHGAIVETSLEEWRRMIDVNLTGVFLCLRAAVPSMIEAGGGAIVTISSSTGPQLVVGNAASYVASKAGVAALTRAVAVDYASCGIRANAVAPGPTETPMLRGLLDDEARRRFGETLPIGRLGRAEEIAAAVLFLSSDAASFVTGAIVPVDGGQTATVAREGEGR